MNFAELLEALSSYLLIHPEDLTEPVMFRLRGNPILMIEETEETVGGQLIFSMIELEEDERQ